ncbi:unnamed protein product [Rotaria magnacalcarata]|uniref:Phosphatidylinositol-3-phosphatase SAC1 n=1 Tax=Rotaria magnacalcarata TaxID=392030 RepID=A0A820A8Q2_9BILA|nr:unnamed protein product [Rotaria magnacalcarata]
MATSIGNDSAIWSWSDANKRQQLNIVDNYTLHLLSDYLIIQPMVRDTKEYLVIDRTSEEIQVLSSLPNVDGAVRRSIHGIIGVINLISGPNLIVITSKQRMGDINGHAIYKVQTTDIIPYARNMSHLNENQKDGGGGKQYTTALIAISAAGQAISPFIVYTGKTLMNTWCRGTIVCLILPPHCTHGLQPIDVVLFNNVKTDWLTIIRNDIKDGNKSIKNSDIPRLMKQLYIEKQSFSTTRIVSSFSRAGIWPFNEHAMMNKVVAPAFSSPSTSTISKTPPPTNILIPRTNSSVVHSSSTTSSSSPKLITVSNVESMDVTLSSDVMMVDGISKRQQQVSFDIQLIKPIEPTFIDAHEIPSSTESTYTVLNTIDFNAAMFEPEREPEPTTQHINQTSSIMLKERNEQTKNPAVQPIDAVREVLVGSLEKQQKHQTTTTTTNFRASRLNNTTGVNITNEDFIRMIQEKASSKTKKTTAKKKTTSIARPTRATTRKKIIIIGVDSDQENDAYMDYESSVRHPGRLIRHRIR